jgi:hypothetical protein
LSYGASFSEGEKQVENDKIATASETARLRTDRGKG